MTDEERFAFEDLLRAGSKLCFKFGQPMDMPMILSYTQPYVKAANAAEKILNPLRSVGERRKVEREFMRDMERFSE